MLEKESNISTECKELGDGLFIYITKTNDPLSILYEVELLECFSMEFVVNFQGSKNFEVIRDDNTPTDPSNPFSVHKNIMPFRRVFIAHLQISDPFAKNILNVKYDFVKYKLIKNDSLTRQIDERYI